MSGHESGWIAEVERRCSRAACDSYQRVNPI
jgi:hypothetical protein